MLPSLECLTTSLESSVGFGIKLVTISKRSSLREFGRLVSTFTALKATPVQGKISTIFGSLRLLFFSGLSIQLCHNIEAGTMKHYIRGNFPLHPKVPFVI
eukprot:UN22825